MPLVPSGRIDPSIQLAVQKHDGCIRSPGTSQEDFADLICGGNSTVIKDIAAHLFRIAVALGGNHDFFVRDGMNQTVVEDSQGIAKNEIDVTFNVTIAEILACRDAWTGVCLTRPGRCKKSVLRA